VHAIGGTSAAPHASTSAASAGAEPVQLPLRSAFASAFANFCSTFRRHPSIAIPLTAAFFAHPLSPRASAPAALSLRATQPAAPVVLSSIAATHAVAPASVSAGPPGHVPALANRLRSFLSAFCRQPASTTRPFCRAFA
jgi:hypothetical protein